MKEEALPHIDLPIEPIITERESATNEIFMWDKWRRQWRMYRPEEWVRLHIASYLFEVLGYPSALAKFEYPIALHRQRRSCDLVVFDNELQPLLLVECKAAHVSIDTTSLAQLSAYASVVPATILLLSNGNSHFCYIRDENATFDLVTSIPTFEEAYLRRKGKNVLFSDK